MTQNHSTRQYIQLPQMSHEKAIEILSLLALEIDTSHNPDFKEAIRKAIVALISEKLSLEVD